MTELLRGAYIYGNESTPVFRTDLLHFIYGLSITTVHPGGCEEASFSFRRPFEGTLVPPDFLGYMFELQLWDEEGCFWVGRIEDFQYDIQEQSVEWLVTAKGYGVSLDDDLYGSLDVSNTLTSAIVEAAVIAKSPQIDFTSVTPTGHTISNTTAVPLKMMKISHIVNWAKRFGDASNLQQIWCVYPDNDAAVRFMMRPRPTVADVFVHMADFENNRGGLQGRRLYNSVTVQFNGGATTVTADDLALQGAGPNGWGVKKVLPLYMREITQTVDGQKVADTALGFFKTAKIAARDLVLKSGVTVLDANKARLLLTRIRAGMLLEFEDIYVSQNPLTNISLSNAALIVSTELHEQDGDYILTITLESLDQLLDASVGMFEQLLQGRTNLNT